MKKAQIRNSTAEFLVFTSQAGENGIEVRVEGETVWLTQKLIGALFEVNVRTVSEHLQNIFASAELTEQETLRNFRTVQNEGGREVASATKLFAQWKAANTPHLRGFAQDGHPKALIENIAEALLTRFEHAPLLDAYDVYQHLMDYWGETMQDDCYLITADGWVAAAQPRLIIEDKASKTKTRPDFALGKKKYAAELIPPALVIARYHAKEQAAIEALEAQLAALAQQMEEMAEEHGGEGGLLEDARNDKDKLTKASVAARLKEIGPKNRDSDPDTADERQALLDYPAIIEQEADTGAKLKAAQDALMAKVAAKYGQLTEDEIKSLVVDDKWLATIAGAVQGELDRVSQTLTGRIRQLAERYATPLPKLTSEVAALAARVEQHLKQMGAVWA